MTQRTDRQEHEREDEVPAHPGYGSRGRPPRDALATATTALKLQVRNLLRRIDHSLDVVHADETITPALAHEELAGLAETLRGASALLDLQVARSDSRGCPFAVGDRFWSEGLQSSCRVLSIDRQRLEFITESPYGSNVHTDAPLDLVRKHVAAGRWRKQAQGASVVSGADTP